MNIWKILEIEPTDDKKKIKSAYRAKLREVNPESQPETFMELREAYEKALKEVETDSKQQLAGDAGKNCSGGSADGSLNGSLDNDTNGGSNKSTVDQWKLKLELLYKDNTKRFQLDAWEALFQDEVCYSLDTRDEAGKEFMGFFGEHIHISQAAIKKAEEVFHFTDKLDELAEYFPEPLLDYFVNYKLKEEEYPQHHYFALNPLPEADYDEYLQDFNELCNALQERNTERAALLLKRLDETGIKHPSTEIKRAEFYREDGEKVGEILQNIEDIWGEYDEAVFAKGEYLLKQGQAQEAEPYFRRTLEINPDYENALILLAISLREQKKYREARDLLFHTENTQLQLSMSGFLDQLDEEIIPTFEKQLQEGTLAEEDIYDLSLVYYRRNRLEEAQKTIDLLEGKEIWKLKHLRICMLIQHRNKAWENALSLADDLIQLLEAAEKNKDNLRYLTEAHMMRGAARLNLGQKKGALEDLDEGIARTSNPEEQLLQKATILMRFQFYELAADTFSRLIEQNPRHPMYRFGRGMCCFQAKALQEAHDDFEYLCMLDEENMEAHIYRMKIYLEAGAQQEVEDTFAFFEEKGYDTDSVRLMRGIYQEYSGNYEAAQKIFEEIIKGYDPEKSDLEHIGEVYEHLVQVDIELDKRGLVIFKHLNEGVKKEPDYIPLLEKRWLVNTIFEDEEDVEKDVREILRLNPYHEGANSKMADICEKNGDMETAAKCWNQLEQAGSLFFYVNKGFNEIFAGNLEEAERMLQAAEARDDEDMGVHKLQALYYNVLGEARKAIEIYNVLNEEDTEENYYEEIACCYCHLGDFDSARRQYELLLQKGGAGDKIFAYDMLFDLELGLGNYKEAEKMLKLWQKSRKKLFKDDAYKVKAGKLYIAKGEYKKAKEILDMAEVSESEAREYMGSLNLYEGKPKKALKYFLSGIKEWPDYIEFYYYAALASLVSGDHQKAEYFAKKGLKQLEQNQKMGGQLKDRYKCMGGFYSLLGDYEKAQMYFEKGMKSPMCIFCKACQCQELYTKMAVMYQLMGDTEKCREALARAEKIKPDDFDVAVLKQLLDKKLL